MGGRIDTARKSANNGQSGIRQLIRQLFRRFHSVMRGSPRADNSDGVVIALLQFAPDIEHDGRRVDFPQWPRIRWRFLRDYGRSEIAHAFKLCSEIDGGFPRRNLVCNLVTDSFHLAKLAAFCHEDLLRFPENFKQLPQSHGPNSRQHVERNARFSRVHDREYRGRSRSPRRVRGLRYTKMGSRPRRARRVLMVWAVRWFADFPSRLAGSGSSTGTTAQQLHGLAHYTQSCSLLPGLFVVPGVHLQAALDKHWPSFLQIFTCNLRKARPEYNVDKRDFLTSFSAVGSVSAIDGNAEIANCAALGCVTHFRVAGEVSKQNDFVKTGHGRVIRKSLSFRHLFSGLFLLLGEAFVILTIHFRIEFKFRLQLRDYSRIGNKDKVHVISGIERTGHIGELALVHFLHLFDLRTFFLKLRFQSVDDFPDGFFFALGVQHQQRFITAVHASSVPVLLKVFIAETSPLSIAHFNASTARPVVDLTTGFSSSKNRFST